MTDNPTIFFTENFKITNSELGRELATHLEYDLVKDKTNVTRRDVLRAISLTIRDRLIRNWLRTQKKYNELNTKKVYYLSLEFLMGSLLGNSLINLGLYDECSRLLAELGYDIETIIAEETDMGLGNGGLGRLAACFLDSLSTLNLPAYGYGIRYRYGIFDQKIENGYQVEKPDEWLRYGNPWEIMRPEHFVRIKFGGKVTTEIDDTGKPKTLWTGTKDVFAIPYDIPVPGYRNETVNNLRLWQAKSTNEFNLYLFNQGQYDLAEEDKNESEAISKVLYPNDNIFAGKVLRLKQQYFFVAATLKDIIRSFKKINKSFANFAEKTAIQLNDTHPAIAIPELMRLLTDEEGMEWNVAWEITKNTFGYTNHTIVPEAMEQWSEELIAALLPRHLQIIKEIDKKFCEEMLSKEFTNEEVSKMSIFGNGMVRMANLAIIGSHAVNGVAELHTSILKKYVFPEFYKADKIKFQNKTNGVSPRRFILEANPYMSGLISSKIGTRWIYNLDEIREIEQYKNDIQFIADWQNVKKQNKLKLIDYIKKHNGVHVEPHFMFDAQIKRFHEYKRQLLNILHVVTLYNRIKANPGLEITPRAVIISGKAAPSYFAVKLHIKLINCIADIINNDEEVNSKLKLIFLKNYSVSLAEKIIPASDLSEQISTAGFEASGTGNMKFAMNGALTIGTLDGANIEIKNEVSEENIFIFGLKSDEIMQARNAGYNPRMVYETNNELKLAIDMIASDYFNKNEPGIFKSLVDNLLGSDYYFVLADYQSYIGAQDKVSKEFTDKSKWTKKAIINVARSGKFSSDRTILDYARDIWGVK